MFSPKVLGYLKEKQVRNDKVFYTCGQSLEKEDATSTVEQGYVMKNDPFRKQMLVSSKVVLIEKGKWLDEQIEDIDVRTISYFQLRPESLRPETAERIKKSVSLSESDGDWRAADKQSELQKGSFILHVKCRDCGKIIQSSGNTKNIDISKRRILPGTSSIKDMSLIQKILLAYSLNAIEN